jgi:hypothetical protein
MEIRMPLKPLIAATIGFLAMATAALSPAAAQPYVIDRGGPWGFYGGFGPYPAPDLNPRSRSYNPDAWKYMYKLNCVDAGRSLIARGFIVVQQIHCQGNIYAFVALRRGKPYRVVMDPWSGTILSVGRTR